MKTEPIYIVGPTAVGKTETAIGIGRELEGEIVSADSMQVYHGMDIGTAKPTPEQLEQLPHHLVNILDLDQTFSVARFKKMAEDSIKEIRGRGRVPIVVGGTGLYVKSLTEGIFEGPSADWDHRRKLREDERRHGTGYLYGELRRVDPRSADRVKPNDLRRVVRALEVYHLTGRPISEHQKEWAQKRPDITIIGLDVERGLLDERISKRVDEMFRRGLVEETRRLLELGIESNRTAMQAIGYKEVIGYVRGAYDLGRAKELLKRNSRRYAKRQLTWFRKDDRIKWFDVSEMKACQLLRNILDYLGERDYECGRG